jgi:hypothetical protein
MHHCDACGWEGQKPATHHEPFFTKDGTTTLWTMRVCPECGEEVYQTVILREPPIAGGEPI